MSAFSRCLASQYRDIKNAGQQTMLAGYFLTTENRGEINDLALVSVRV
ncbi:hypothetical protein ACUY2J_08785 [Corynebacterium kroppenstedtii]